MDDFGRGYFSSAVYEEARKQTDFDVLDIIASDYRFHGVTSKRDEWGGADLDDVLNLVPAARSLDFVDPKRLFMLDVSRGATMTYLALIQAERATAVRQNVAATHPCR